MVKDIKILLNDEEIEPENNLIVLPYKNSKEFISIDEARQIIRLLQSQINIIEVQNADRKTGHTADKANNNCKTVSAT